MISMTEAAWLVAGVALLSTTVLAVYAAYLRQRLLDFDRRMGTLTTQLDAKEDESRRLTAVDGLTGMANRRSFDDAVKREWARASHIQQPLAIIMIDLDHFKNHNEAYGHQAGDECLKQVAITLKRCVRRPQDLVARYGGEEFAVVLLGANASGAAVVAERMRLAVQSLKLQHVKNATGNDITVSLGVAAATPEGDSSLPMLIAAADKALHRAKMVGRNQVIVAESLGSDSDIIQL